MFFAHGILKQVLRSSPQGSDGLNPGMNGPPRPAKSVLTVRMTSLTLNYSLNLAIMRYVPARLWLRTDEMSILVQDRRGQRDPRKRPRARGAIMARPRCKPHRPFYFLWGNTASRASGPVVKVAAASRANAPVRKCGVKYQVSWWEQPDIPRKARIVYDIEGRVVDMVRGSLMHAARLGAGTAAVIAVLGLPSELMPSSVDLMSPMKAGLASNDELCRAVSDALDGITVDGTLEAVHSIWYGTMPYDLTAKTVSGVNMQASDSSSDEAESSDDEVSDDSGDSSSSSQEGTITDDDINKLNS